MSKYRKNHSTERVSKGQLTSFAINYKLIMEMSTRERRRKQQILERKGKSL
jgi:hypothetical protein